MLALVICGPYLGHSFYAVQHLTFFSVLKNVLEVKIDKNPWLPGAYKYAISRRS
jgi:hypothetical protein